MRWPVLHWELIVGGLAVAAAAVAFWVTLHSHVYKYPGWLAVQKADFILGPIFVGLYWHHRRPHNRLGLLLVALGLVGVVYVLESSAVPALFGIGLLCETVIYPLIIVVILAFPNGRLEGAAAKLIVVALLIGGMIPALVLNLSEPSLAPFLPISGCEAACPRNGLAVLPPVSWTAQDEYVQIVTAVATSLATAAVLVWRFVTGTPPRRRALAIGAPIAMLFLVAQAVYNTNYLLTPGAGSTSQEPTPGPLHWIYAVTPSLFWYGFLFALIAAEVFAGRVMRKVVRHSLGRPALGDLEGMLRGPLGDPGLRLGFWRSSTRDWVGHDGAVLEPPGASQAVTVVDRDGRPAAAIVHDTQLSEDPELLQAAGAAALLAQENAELDAAWKQALRELQDSRGRLAAAGDRERRKLERDLHDSAQQRFVAAEINLALAGDPAADSSELVERITEARTALEDGLEELREIAHGIYPRELARSGLSRALNLLAARYPGKATVTETDVGRCPPEIEATIYYGCLEAVQNASKHAGADAHISIRLHTDQDLIFLEVRDNGRGFDADTVPDGVGLQNIRDRFGAVGGRAEIRSEPGRGTVMSAAAPLGNRSTRDAKPGQRDMSLKVAPLASSPPAS